MADGGLKRGDILKGRYEIESLIGKGGMSRVFRARDTQLNNKLWAVKEVDRRKKDPTGRPIEQSLAGEAEILAKLDHPRIVDIIDIQKTDKFIYVVTDYVEGESLDKVVRREGPQSEEDVQRWMLDICDALSYLHNQDPPIIYRDMKPNNIMLHPDGYVKLIDFGVVNEYKDTESQDTVAFGTPGYAPPEQYGKSRSNVTNDIYALGATMWHLLTGEAPPTGKIPSVTTKNPKVGEGFANTIIPKCTEFAPEDRYQSCDELAADLEIYRELTSEYRSKQKRKITLSLGSIALALVFLLVGFVTLGAHNAALSSKYDNYLSVGRNLMTSEAGGKIDETLTIEGVDGSNTDTSTGNLLLAMNKKPGDPEAVFELIKSYKLDDRLTVGEKDQLKNVLNANDAALAGSDKYAELNYEIGRLFWNYYEYGGNPFDVNVNNPSGYLASKEYFKKAAEDDSFDNKKRARSYYEIAEVYSTHADKKNTGEDDEDYYKNYWNSLEVLAESLESETNERVQIESCQTIVSSLMKCIYDFADSGIDKQDIKSMYEKVKKTVNDLRSTTKSEDNKSRLNLMWQDLEGSIAMDLREILNSSGL